MQLRISQGPEAALGLGEAISSESVRAAFLQLTKQFHPARFGRMSNEVQRLSNEVFLGIKAAHDTLQKVFGGGPVRTSAIPIVADGTQRTPAPVMRTTSSIARVGSSQIPLTPPSQLARGTDRPARQPTPPSRSGTPPLGVPLPPKTPTTQSMPQQQRPANRLFGGDLNPGTIRHNGVSPPPQPPTTQVMPKTQPVPTTQQPTQAIPRAPAASFDERGALREAMILLDTKQWMAARQALHNLAAKVPQSKSYRALLCLARGREAQAAGRPDEALLEYERALQHEPELAQAKQAIAELPRSR